MLEIQVGVEGTYITSFCKGKRFPWCAPFCFLSVERKSEKEKDWLGCPTFTKSAAFNYIRNVIQNKNPTNNTSFVRGPVTMLPWMHFSSVF